MTIPKLPGIFDTFDVDNPAVITYEIREPTPDEVANAKKILADLKEGLFSVDEEDKEDGDE